MSDYNLFSYYEDSSDQTIAMGIMGSPANPPNWSDTVKITSGCTDFRLNAAHIYGGQEDCVDCNNKATHCTIDASYHPQGKYLATIKGGCHGITLLGSVYAHGTEVDVDLGNWSDQSENVTSGTILGLLSQTERPIRVRVLNALKPTFLGGTGPYVYVFPKPDSFLHPLIVRIFLWLGRRGWI